MDIPKQLPRAINTVISLTWFDWLRYLVSDRRPEELVSGELTDEGFDRMFTNVEEIREKEIGHLLVLIPNSNFL